jgi:hypothetical protein
MNFQQVNASDSSVLDSFISFCLRSKPYPFCSLPTFSARIIQIKNYYEHLFEVAEIYVLKQDGQIVFFIATHEKEDGVCVEFVYGSPFTILGEFREFRYFYQKQKNKTCVFYSYLLREHKLNAMFNMIKKRDKNAKISLDNGKILVLWYNDNGLQT